MAIIDTHRAAYNRPNITLGTPKENLSPTTTERKETFFSVRIEGRIRQCKTIAEVNAILSVNPSARVVKTTRTTTTTTHHKRIR